MRCVPSCSVRAAQAFTLVESLQTRFVRALEEWGGQSFIAAEWLRDEGRHGGGVRFGIGDSERLGRASVNVSQVHYDDDPDRKLGSATALSTIIHPTHPKVPSVHIHISWTELKNGQGYWRIMADLNPSNPNEADRQRFAEALQSAAPNHCKEAVAQGDRYFFIPAVDRCRGVVHFYLESYSSGDFETDLALAHSVGETAIDTYMEIISNVPADTVATERERKAQLNYHTLYLFQVLTLDRGTTAGLLVHDQNDVGILGSLPARVDRTLLASWGARLPAPQHELMEGLLRALPDEEICTIDDAVKLKLAVAVRTHYDRFPEALELQASGDARPPTGENHR